jgi:hypothetical protein
MTDLALRAHRATAWLLVAGVALQGAMATFGLFVLLGMRGHVLHAGAGRALAVLPILVLLTALVARVDRRQLALVGGALAIAALQVAIILLGRAGVAPAMALHPIVGGGVLLGAAVVAGRADRLVRARAGQRRMRPDALVRRAPMAAARPG